ncbi:ExiS [Mycoplasma phage phiMFV1]|nr:restriction endonuclease [Mycoplasmopsis fermentans]YP_044805.1 restriction endonuclease [Mycoplasma phage phiMFV1]AAT65055.1 ExiS [Mycoplasma phage phiMFV1]AAT65073.1 ExiS [Mycoplasma phage phiMFV1]ADV34593.1 ExiS [Mycoplasmopsis fermentans M64]
MKMPNYKDLNFNIKRELNKLKPKSFEEWKEAKSKVFCLALGKYLTKINSHQPDIFKNYYQVLFYHSFINYKREEELLSILKAKGYQAKRTNLKMDGIYKIDIVATKGNEKIYIQVKLNKPKALELKNLHSFLRSKAFQGLIAWKESTEWKFKEI